MKGIIEIFEVIPEFIPERQVEVCFSSSVKWAKRIQTNTQNGGGGAGKGFELIRVW